MSRKLNPIHQADFEADCRAARERAFAVIAERHGAERTALLPWLTRPAPRAKPFGHVPLKPEAATAVERKPVKSIKPTKAPRGHRYSYAGRAMTQCFRTAGRSVDGYGAG